MSELTDLVANLEQKYGSPIKYVPRNDPDFITIQKKYWKNSEKHKTPKAGYKCKFIELQTKREHIFKSFTQASRFYGYSHGWALNQYKAQKKGHKNPKYRIIKLEKD